ncbi:MAG: AraC family transcriptional regulator [Candidatus Cloacimonetes bacterium]|nr:AraC family transcriptional regulator [Candidatus Cloacimonadota bacterium]
MSYHVQSALDYIEAHLKDNISLEDISDEANYSPWHFHRLFFRITGYSVGEYLRKRRLTEACKELVFTMRSIACIAKDYKFESQASFTRSFKNTFQSTPGAIRRSLGPVISFPPLHFHNFNHKGETMITPRFEKKAAFKVIGMQCTSTMNNNTIPQLWEKFNPNASLIPNAVSMCCLGICYSDSSVTPSNNTPFYYLACREVSSITEIPEGMMSKELPAAEYAVFEHIGSLDTLDKTYKAIYDEWLADSGFKQTKDYDFELYDCRFSFGDPKSIMEIWIPISR